MQRPPLPRPPSATPTFPHDCITHHADCSLPVSAARSRPPLLAARGGNVFLRMGADHKLSTPRDHESRGGGGPRVSTQRSAAARNKCCSSLVQTPRLVCFQGARSARRRPGQGGGRSRYPHPRSASPPPQLPGLGFPQRTAAATQHGSNELVPVQHPRRHRAQASRVTNLMRTGMPMAALITTARLSSAQTTTRSIWSTWTTARYRVRPPLPPCLPTGGANCSPEPHCCRPAAEPAAAAPESLRWLPAPDDDS